MIRNKRQAWKRLIKWRRRFSRTSYRPDRSGEPKEQARQTRIGEPQTFPIAFADNFKTMTRDVFNYSFLMRNHQVLMHNKKERFKDCEFASFGAITPFSLKNF